jgi:hypothetical protein
MTPFRFLDLRLTVRISRGAISWQAMVTIRDQSRTILGTRISSIPYTELSPTRFKDFWRD